MSYPDPDYGPAGGPVGDGWDDLRLEHYSSLRRREEKMPRTKGAAVKVYVPVDLDDLKTAKRATPDEVAKLAPKTIGREKAERTPVMLRFDKDVEALYEWWIAHDKPKAMTKDYPPLKVFVKPEQAATVRFLARKSAQFLDHGIRFGTDTTTQDGRVCVSYCVTDKQERKAGKKGSENQDPNPSMTG